jgi:preprotein translocase subunit SecD
MSPAQTPSISWISDLDVMNARLLREPTGTFMAVELTEAAGARLTKLTQKNIGRVLRYTWDGRPMLDASINTPLGRRFKFSAPPPPEGLMMQVILESGRLPAAVEGCAVEGRAS